MTRLNHHLGNQPQVLASLFPYLCILDVAVYLAPGLKVVMFLGLSRYVGVFTEGKGGHCCLEIIDRCVP